MPATLIVIPCFRERERLPKFLPGLCAALQGEPDVRVRVVDDGSGAEEQKWAGAYIEELRTQFPLLDPAQLNAENHGKGGAVYSGWNRPEGAVRLGFVDADGAVPAGEVVRLLQLPASHPDTAVYAVRTGECGTRVVRDWHRRVAGQVFRRIVRHFFHFPLPDTQCGFKLIPATAYHTFKASLQEMRFTFDVELTWHLLHSGVRITPVPINWTESPGSRLRPGSAWAMYQSIRDLRRRLGDWQRH